MIFAATVHRGIFTILALVFIAGFFLLEGLLRRGGASRSLDRGHADKGSTLALASTYGICVTVLAGLVFVDAGRLASSALHWIGLGMMPAGLGFRAWSMQSLGASYSRTLRVRGSQEIVMSGPYKFIRHPGYLGSILAWVGSALAAANWIALAVIVPLVTGVYVYRISAEEAMLSRAFGEKYVQYRKSTWRLLPFLY